MADDDKDKDKPKAVQGSDGVHGKHHSFDSGTSSPKGYQGRHRTENGDVVPLKKKKR